MSTGFSRGGIYYCFGVAFRPIGLCRFFLPVQYVAVHAVVERAEQCRGDRGSVLSLHVAVYHTAGGIRWPPFRCFSGYLKSAIFSFIFRLFVSLVEHTFCAPSIQSVRSCCVYRRCLLRTHGVARLLSWIGAMHVCESHHMSFCYLVSSCRCGADGLLPLPWTCESQLSLPSLSRLIPGCGVGWLLACFASQLVLCTMMQYEYQVICTSYQGNM